VFDFFKCGVLRKSQKKTAEHRLQRAGAEQEDEQANGRDKEEDFCNGTGMAIDIASHKGGKEKNEDKDVEKLFEDDRTEDDRRRCPEVGSIGKDAHNVANPEGQDIIGGDRGHKNSGADRKTCSR